MPERDKYPTEYFDSNPYEDVSVDDAYSAIRWGNEPTESFEIESIEPMVTIGDLAQIKGECFTAKFGEYESPFLAVGKDSNKLYLVPKNPDGSPVDIPESGFERVGEVYQTDYYSDKGGDDAYYYHEHEEPYPVLYVHRASGVCLIEPSMTEDGKRSYAVADEGIIG